MSVTPRRLQRDDMEQAARVMRASFDERLPWLSGLHTPEQDFAFFRNQLFGKCEIWGVDFDGTLAGIIAFRAGWIDQLYVLASQQRRGIGDALLRVAKADAALLDLWTFQRNVIAHRFYEARGFVAVQTTDGAHNEEREPDVRYRWER